MKTLIWLICFPIYTIYYFWREMMKARVQPKGVWRLMPAKKGSKKMTFQYDPNALTLDYLSSMMDTMAVWPEEEI